MTKSSVTELLKVIFQKFIIEKDITEFNNLKANFFEMFTVIPVENTETITMEKNMFEIDSIARVESNFNDDTINPLLTDFHRILIIVASSLLPE